MGLLERTARTIHAQQGWYVSDSFDDAPIASWGTLDGRVFERLGDLRTTKNDQIEGLPEPTIQSVVHGANWFLDGGTDRSEWKPAVEGVTGVPISVSAKITFTEKYSVACLLAGYHQEFLVNNSSVGDILASVHDEDDRLGVPGQRWRCSRKWVYSAVRVTRGIIVMSRESNVTVDLNAKGIVPVSGAPVELDLGCGISCTSNQVQVKVLDGTCPFVKLCEVFDPLGPLSTARWRQIG